MWSVALIIGVAVASSTLVLVVGVTLAVSIERHRHRNLMRRQNFGASLEAYHEQNIGINEVRNPRLPQQRRSIRRSIRIPDTWRDIPSQEDISVSMPSTEVPEAIPARRKKLHKPMLTRKRSHRKHKSKRAFPLPFGPRSPLSAITEISTSPPVSPYPAEISASGPDRLKHALHNAKQEQPISAGWSLFVTKARGRDPDKGNCRQNSVSRAHVTGHNLNLLQPTPIARSVSMNSTTSAAPAEPLPDLPVIEPYRPLRPQKSRASTTSIDTVGSSVLGTLASTPNELSPVPSRSRSRTFQEFDFGFGRSPPATRHLQSMKPMYNSFESKADAKFPPTIQIQDTMHDHSKHNTVDASDRLRSAIQEAGRSASGNSGRHSMFEPRSVIGRRADGLLPSPMDDCVDPFTAVVPPRPASAICTTMLQWDTKPQFTKERNSVSSTDSAKKGHRRQNCVRISNLPLKTPTFDPRRSPMPVLDEDKSEQYPPPLSKPKSVPNASATSNGSKFPSIISPIPRFLPIVKENRSSIPVTDPLDSNIMYGRALPALRQRHSPEWLSGDWPPTLDDKVDFAPSSPENGDTSSRNSPILPSPAFTARGLRPRNSPIRGPRSQPRLRSRESSASPMRGKYVSSNLRKASKSPRGSHAKRNVSGVRLDRISDIDVTDSSNNLLSEYWKAKPYLKPSDHQISVLQNDGYYRRADRSVSPSAPFTFQLKSQEQKHSKPQFEPASLTTASPCSSPSRSVSSLNTNPRKRSLTQSVTSTSIWEDVSVHDCDSPEPELPTPTRLQTYLKAASNEQTNSTSNRNSRLTLLSSHSRSNSNVNSRPATPRAKLEDYEAYENFVMGYTTASHDGDGINERRGESDLVFGGSTHEAREQDERKSVGLGLRIEGGGGSGNSNPRAAHSSLYDKDGFLKPSPMRRAVT